VNLKLIIVVLIFPQKFEFPGFVFSDVAIFKKLQIPPSSSWNTNGILLRRYSYYIYVVIRYNCCCCCNSIIKLLVTFVILLLVVVSLPITATMLKIWSEKYWVRVRLNILVVVIVVVAVFVLSVYHSLILY